MIDSLYCRSTAVLLAMHVWLYVVRSTCTLYCTWSQEQVGLVVSAKRAAAASRRELGASWRRKQNGLLTEAPLLPGVPH